MVHNTGIAFGLGGALPPGVVAAAATLVALANLADRVVDGRVIDYFDVGRWPTFNLADVSLIVGITLLVRGASIPMGATSPGASPPRAG